MGSALDLGALCKGAAAFRREIDDIEVGALPPISKGRASKASKGRHKRKRRRQPKLSPPFEIRAE